MEILWWWAPALVVTVVAVLWVSWLGRDGRGEVDPDEAVARMAEALTQRPVLPHDRVGGARPERPRDRSSGVAIRPSQGKPRP